jgi:hypothetical protein
MSLTRLGCHCGIWSLATTAFAFPFVFATTSNDDIAVVTGKDDVTIATGNDDNEAAESC